MILSREKVAKKVNVTTFIFQSSYNFNNDSIMSTTPCGSQKAFSPSRRCARQRSSHDTQDIFALEKMGRTAPFPVRPLLSHKCESIPLHSHRRDFRGVIRKEVPFHILPLIAYRLQGNEGQEPIPGRTGHKAGDKSYGQPVHLLRLLWKSFVVHYKPATAIHTPSKNQLNKNLLLLGPLIHDWHLPLKSHHSVLTVKPPADKSITITRSITGSESSASAESCSVSKEKLLADSWTKTGCQSWSNDSSVLSAF